MKKNIIFEAVEFENVKQIIYNSAKKYENQIAFVIKHQENKKVSYENITYKQFLEDINKFGTSLYNMGLKGKRVAIIGKNRYEWVLAHFANLLGAIVSVPLDKDLQYDELESSIIRSKADCIIFDEKLEEKIKKIKNENKTYLTNYICMSKMEGYKNVKELVTEGEKFVIKM